VLLDLDIRVQLRGPGSARERIAMSRRRRAAAFLRSFLDE
jgi:hypothetical protein